jgi:hypothetical protein
MKIYLQRIEWIEVNWIYLVRRGSNGAFCEHGKKPRVSIKREGYCDWLKDYYLIKKSSAPWS